jgi:hypothetical protein
MMRICGNTFCLAALLFFLGVSSSAATEKTLTDQKMERFLLKSRVITRFPDLIAATTFPMSMDLEHKDEVRKAVFKYGHTERSDSEGLARAGVEGPLLDSYRHEVAAYRLDRALGLGMVPVAVLRSVTTDGAMIEWIPNAVSLLQLRESGKYPHESKHLAEQLAIMNLFDALIMNLDRKETDQLITMNDWRLYLIDHSCAFHTSTELPKSFDPHALTVPPSLHRALERLQAKPLAILLDGLLNKGQIEALLQRRDKIMAKMAE